MELSKEEMELLGLYTNDYLKAREKAGMLQASLTNLEKMALFARGLTPETHVIDENGNINEIKQPVPPEPPKV